MLSTKFTISYIILLTIIAEIQSLVEVSTTEDTIMGYAEKIIRNTINHIFASLNIRDVNWKPKLKQFFTIHNYFMSITLTDCDHLKKIVELSRVYNIDNNTQYLIAKVNEVLDGSDKNTESNVNDKYVEKYIATLISKLKDLKSQYKSKNEGVMGAKEINDTNNNEIANQTRYKETETKIDEILYDDDNFKFWKPNGRRIFRGFRTRIKHFPFMASVQFFKKFQCAGSIIKNDLVITSASCLQISWNNRFFRENPPFVSVQIGSDYYEHGGENIDAQAIYFYPTYDPKTLNNNLAIIRLTRRINFRKRSRRVKKIDIDRNPSKWIPNKRFDLVTVVGWGAKDSSNTISNVLNNKLSYAELDYYPLHECRKHYSRAFVTKRNFCAGFFSKGGGACNRDAGGPAVINGKLLGIISFGSPICGLPDSPTVFTKLGFYRDWIDGILEKEVPYTYKRTTTPLFPKIFTVVEKFRTKDIIMNPIGTTPKPIAIDKVDALRIPQQHDYGNFSSFGLTKPKDIIMNPIGTTPKPMAIDNVNALKISQEDDYDDYSSFGLDSKESFENIKTHLREVTYQPISLEPKDVITQTVRMTAVIPITESIRKGETSSELDESEENESNDPPTETGTESAERITMYGKFEEKQNIQNTVRFLDDNLDIDKLLNETDSSKRKISKAEQANVSKNFFNDINQSSSIDDLSSSNEDEKGLNIPAESFQNLPSKNSRKSHNYDKLSQSLLFEVVSKAIEEEIKLQVREKRKNVKEYSI